MTAITPTEKATVETVTGLRWLNDRLVMFTTTKPEKYSFSAGQYARLGLTDDSGVGNPHAPPAMFRITTAADERAIDEALAQWPHEHLLHAVLFARAGLRDDAAAALERARAAGDARAAKIRP